MLPCYYWWGGSSGFHFQMIGISPPKRRPSKHLLSSSIARLVVGSGWMDSTGGGKRQEILLDRHQNGHVESWTRRKASATSSLFFIWVVSFDCFHVSSSSCDESVQNKLRNRNTRSDRARQKIDGTKFIVFCLERYESQYHIYISQNSVKEDDTRQAVKLDRIQPKNSKGLRWSVSSWTSRREERQPVTKCVSFLPQEAEQKSMTHTIKICRSYYYGDPPNSTMTMSSRTSDRLTYSYRNHQSLINNLALLSIYFESVIALCLLRFSLRWLYKKIREHCLI